MLSTYADRESLLESCEELILARTPNLLRLYVNPHATAACWCLTRLIARKWGNPGLADDYQVFLANSGEEALNGALKLARYVCNREGKPHRGRLVALPSHFEHVVRWRDEEGRVIEFVPDIEVISAEANGGQKVTADQIGFIVSALSDQEPTRSAVPPPNDIGNSSQDALRIVCLGLASLRGKETRTHAPDIIVFDETLVNGEAPFGAFAARRQWFRHWRARGKATFHSTTFQPNSISTYHLLKTLRRELAEFMSDQEATLSRIASDSRFRRKLFGSLFSPSLTRLARIANVDECDVRVEEHFVDYGGRRVFDGVGGVACSVRGHNPPEFVAELREMPSTSECVEELRQRLTRLTGLPCLSPASSGASAVELALKCALVSRMPREHVLVLKGGFGGKTLLALTGTTKTSLKAGLEPLYRQVVHVDPFAADAEATIKAAFHVYPIGVVQMEVIQGVGGVRPIPERVLRCLDDERRRRDCLLLVDEVQTGMFRTGSFCRSLEVGLRPDLMTIGKGTSDMMIPSSFVLLAQRVADSLRENGCDLLDEAWRRQANPLALATLLRTLRSAEEGDLASQVRKRGELYARCLGERLAECPLVGDIRCHGLLIGIELSLKSRVQRRLRKLISQLVLGEMFEDRHFPLLMGFCQYEPHVLKFTPPLETTDEEIERSSDTIARVLHKSIWRMLGNGGRLLGRLLR